jgi:ParB family chromosome partitioning protein
MSKKGLGRGFADLIPTDDFDEEFDLTIEEDKEVSTLKELPLEKVEPDPEQPRKDFDKEALEALADSIKEQGVLQPIVVTKNGAKYRIVAGERRWRAAKIAKLKTIPAIVRTVDGQNRLELEIIENAQREDLNGIELATAYAKLKAQFNLTVEEIAKRIGKSVASVKNTMRLLDLPERAKKVMREQRLSEGVMRPLITAKEEVIEEVLPKIVDEGWSVRQVERYVKQQKKPSSEKAIKTNAVMKKEDSLSEKYHARVRINEKRISFTFKTQKELNNWIKDLENSH